MKALLDQLVESDTELEHYARAARIAVTRRADWLERRVENSTIGFATKSRTGQHDRGQTHWRGRPSRIRGHHPRGAGGATTTWRWRKTCISGWRREACRQSVVWRRLSDSCSTERRKNRFSDASIWRATSSTSNKSLGVLIRTWARRAWSGFRPIDAKRRSPWLEAKFQPIASPVLPPKDAQYPPGCRQSD